MNNYSFIFSAIYRLLEFFPGIPWVKWLPSLPNVNNLHFSCFDLADIDVKVNECCRSMLKCLSVNIAYILLKKYVLGIIETRIPYTVHLETPQIHNYHWVNCQIKKTQCSYGTQNYMNVCIQAWDRQK